MLRPPLELPRPEKGDEDLSDRGNPNKKSS